MQSQASAEHGIPGGAPGTERWVVMLRGRSFSLNQALQNIRSEATLSGRQIRVAALEQLVANDQTPIAQAVTAAGGIVEQHFWVINALIVQIPHSAVAVLRGVPRVTRLVPVRAYSPADAVATGETGIAASPPPPIAVSTDSLNHNVGDAWAILGGGGPQYKGAGARIAVFDTGIEADINGTNGATVDVHPAFGNGTGGTRIEAFLQAQAVSAATRHADINICQTSGVTPFVGTAGPHGYRSSFHHSVAGHGTAMAAIIAGRSYTAGTGANTVTFVGTGHAPDATLIDVAMSSFPAVNPSNQQQAGTAFLLWEYTDAGYLGAVQKLRTHILLNRPAGQTAAYVHVVNISGDGWSDPTAPVSVALDHLGRDEDTLIVVAAGNGSDITEVSHGCHHALAVGGVHARHPGNASAVPPQPANLAFVPMPQSARGPLFSDHRRFFPDVCATGAGPGSFDTGSAIRRFRYPHSGTVYPNSHAEASGLLMPGVDLLDLASRLNGANPNNVSPDRRNLGTSEACAQVAGAAALYRGKLPTATAEETRAAILLNVLGTYVSASGTSADTAAVHSYTNRNTFGVGYVRDDLLAEFAVRATAIRPLAQVVTLSNSSPTATVNYGPLQAGMRYGVVICWRRLLPTDEDADLPEGPLPNVDLEIQNLGSAIARSASPANSYERVVFLAPSGGSGDPTPAVVVRLINTIPANQSVAVQLVAREFASDIDPDTVAEPVHAASGECSRQSAGTGCTSQAVEWQVDRIVPTAYANAYGSAPFGYNFQATWYEHPGYNRGVDLDQGRLSTNLNTFRVHYWIDAAQMGGPMTIAGLAFRTWLPFSPTSDLSCGIQVAAGNFGSPPNFQTVLPPATGVMMGATLRAPGRNAGESGLDNFAVLVPFTGASQSTLAYNGTDRLNIWITVTSSITPFVVDGVTDGALWPYGMYYVGTHPIGGGAAPVSVPGQVPIIGLIAASTSAAREPRLETFGEPLSGNGNASLDIDWRLSQAPPGVAWGLLWGNWSPTPTVLGSCSLWLTNGATVASGVTSVDGIAQGRITFPSGLVHYGFGLQAAIAPSTLSNALRLTVGGGL